MRSTAARRERSSLGMRSARSSASWIEPTSVARTGSAPVSCEGRAAGVGEHEDAGMLGGVNGRELLGDEVHAVGERGDDADVRGLQAGGDLVRRVRGEIQLDGVRLAEARVDALGDLDHGGALGLVLRHVVARGRGPLHEARLVAPALVPQQQPLERLEALADALRVVEPVDAEQDLALVALASEGVGAVGSGELAEALRVDAHGVGGDVLAVRGGEQRAQLIAIARRLRADQLVGRERGGEVLVVRDRLPVFAGRDGHVVEVAERPAPAEPLQLAAERDQLVVVHPDEVVGAEQRDQRPRKAAIRGEVGRVLEMAARRLIGEAVQVGPERAVAEALVVVGDLLSGQSMVT